MDLDVKQSVAVAAQIGTPALVWGPPGTGKTAFINSLGKSLNLPIETIIASIREPSDFGGLPVIRPGGVDLEAPSWAKRLLKAKKGILFIDEISTAPPAVQAALLRVIHEGVVGDLQLPESIAMVAAANPPEQAAGGWTLAPPLANRFLHFDWRSNPSMWCDGAIEGWDNNFSAPKVPADWTEGIVGQLALVSSYIRSRPQALHRLPEQETEAGRAWASPRTWEMAAHCLAACEATKVSEDVEIQMIAGAIGVSTAQEFLVWRKELDLPNPEDLLKNPKTFKLPDRSDKVFAVLSSVVVAVLSDLTSDRWLAGWEILSMAAKQGSADVGAFAAKSLAKKMDGTLPIPTKQMPAFNQILKDAGIIPGGKK